jgi:hypothetical protein
LIHPELSVHHGENAVSRNRVSSPSGFEDGSRKNNVALVIEFINMGIGGKGQGVNGLQIKKIPDLDGKLQEFLSPFFVPYFQDKFGRAGVSPLAHKEQEENDGYQPRSYLHGRFHAGMERYNRLRLLPLYPIPFQGWRWERGKRLQG